MQHHNVSQVDLLFSEVKGSERCGNSSVSVQESNVDIVGDKDLEKCSNKLEDVKVEELKREEGPKDLLRPPQEEDVQIETQIAPNPRIQDPEYKFREKVVTTVKKALLNFYAKNPDDTVDEHGNPKEIKIKTSEEFVLHARKLSKKFEAEITESYVSFHGSKEGIEKEKIDSYFDRASIDNQVRKYFSSL